MQMNHFCNSYVSFVDIFTRSFDDFISMKFLIAVFLPASPFISTSSFIILTEICQPPRLFRLPLLFETREDHHVKFKEILQFNDLNQLRSSFETAVFCRVTEHKKVYKGIFVILSIFVKFSMASSKHVKDRDLFLRKYSILVYSFLII